MRRLHYFLLSAMVALIVSLSTTSCSKDNDDNNTQGQENGQDSPGDKQDETSGTADLNFAYGADPSWVTEMEAAGRKFYDKNGNEAECFQLLKNIGFNSARFRVWVNPTAKNGYGKAFCDKADVIAKAKRAQALGMKIMIDFHYSDNWADPSKQWKPEAWDKLSTIDELANAVFEHTTDVLKGLKEAGVDVEWVQIGNETTNGMLEVQSDKSKTDINCYLSNDNKANYITVHNKGQEAAKAIYPDCKIVIHFDRGHRWDKISWGIDALVKGGAKFDIMGLSCYPDITADNWYHTYVDAFIENLNKIATTHNKDVMICELGSTAISSYNAKRAIWNTVIRARNEVPRCKGVFYWEPECYSNYNSYAMGGFTGIGKPSEALEVFSGKINELLGEEHGEAKESSSLYIYDTDGNKIAELSADSDGIWRGKITTTKEYMNFKAEDGKGTKYAVKNWDSWDSFTKAAGEFDHLWFDGAIKNAGTYNVWFDPNKQKWGGEAAN